MDDRTRAPTCATRVGEGEPCSTVGLVCDNQTLCTSPVCEPFDPAPDIVPTRANGEPCTTSDECPDGGLCFDDLDGSRHCFARIPVGGSCDLATSYCDDTVAYCDPDRNCTALPREGDPCGLTRWLDPSHCMHGLKCYDESVDGPICVVSMDGEICADAAAICSLGQVCGTPPQCPEPTCVELRLPGESCGTADVTCVAGTRCEGGSCVSIESQGLFEAACVP